MSTHPIRRALISVSDKTGIVDFARFLSEQNVEIISTGGTANLLREQGVRVRDISDLTQFPEMMDGRVKTLHPLVHGGLLARRADTAHMQAALEHGIQMIDLLVVNLYPFEATLNRLDAGVDDLIENIDIGGPAMIRAAAKNHEDVTVVVDPADYPRVMALMQANGGVPTAQARRQLAAKAYARTAAYDTLVSSWLAGVEGEVFPPYLLDARNAGALRYGENPHQAAALFTRVEGRGGIAQAQQLQGKELSYNNLADADAAWNIVATLETPAVAIIKHANPSGVATGDHNVAAFHRALASDPVSAFGGILATNRAVEPALVEAIGSLFLEVIIAPAVTAEAQQLLASKKNLRVLLAQPETHASPLAAWQIKPISGGYLVQQSDALPINPGAWKTATGTTPDDATMRDALLAFHVCKFVKSNAIVLVKDHATIGVGAGQMSRVDSVRIAIEKARQHGHDTHGAVLASDAFFPFADNVELAAAAGITTLVQPGGSMRDGEVAEAAAKHGMTMLLTGRRHFAH